MLSENRYKEIWEVSEGYFLEVLFANSCPDPKPINFNFEDRKEIFFWMLKKLMKEGHLKLGKNGKFLDGTIEEQINLFRKTLPTPKYHYPIEESPVEITDEVWSQLTRQDTAEMYFWFVSEECPAVAVWVYANGYLEWT
ncbi:DUF596 domain-containing protein [Xenorhabdus sp. Sc-CR9]|uniref:DUF596 domain-containing protein n=1 Tax=Xenorhabdus sp. Sc-CR9 TaxID=2584468 RepID=UPI001F37D4A1|nr:DUF596 domain-containing protein [Xenorhabdus sp. Sc-CR9]